MQELVSHGESLVERVLVGKSLVSKRMRPGAGSGKGGMGPRFTCIGWSVVAADICGLVCVG